MSTNNNVGLNGKGVGVPVKLMHESEGHVVTVRNRRGVFLSRVLSSFRDPFLMRERIGNGKNLYINDAMKRALNTNKERSSLFSKRTKVALFFFVYYSPSASRPHRDERL